MIRLPLLCACTLFLASGVALSQDTESEAAEGTECFNRNYARHFQVVDEQHIVVNVRGDRVYLVELQRRVRNLDRSRALGFDSSTNRVCPTFSKVISDRGDARIRSIREISEAERDALVEEGGDVDTSIVEPGEIEVVIDEPGDGNDQQEDE